MQTAPQPGCSCAILRMSAWTSTEMRGRNENHMRTLRW